MCLAKEGYYTHIAIVSWGIWRRRGKNIDFIMLNAYRRILSCGVSSADDIEAEDHYQ